MWRRNSSCKDWIWDTRSSSQKNALMHKDLMLLLTALILLQMNAGKKPVARS
jgi:hypothetical protein